MLYERRMNHILRERDVMEEGQETFGKKAEESVRERRHRKQQNAFGTFHF